MVEISNFLLALADRLRPLTRPLDVMFASTEMLGEHLSGDRVGYCDVEGDDTLSFPTGWSRGVLDPLSGRMPIALLGDKLVAQFRAGQTAAIVNADLDERVPEGAFVPLGIRATISVPLIREGAWVAGLFLHQIEPRRWSEGDVELVEAVLERTWDAVERARAEEALRRSVAALADSNRKLEFAAKAHQEDRNFNRQIIDSAIDYAIVATDTEGLITRWNEGARRILGWTEEEMLGQHADRFFTPEDVANGRVQTEMDGALETGRGNDERWHLRKNGERFWAFGEMTVLNDADQNIVGFVKVLRDRTEQRRADQERLANEARLRAAYDIARLGTFYWDVVGGRVELDQRGREMFDLNATEQIGQEDIFARIDPKTMGSVHDAAMRAVESKERLENNYSVIWDDGSRHDILSIGDAILDEQGNTKAMFGVFADVTAQKQAEALLREAAAKSESKVNAFFELSPDLLVVVDVRESGEVVIDDINPRTEAVWERARSEVVGKSLQRVVQAEIASDIERYARECFQLGTPISYMAKRRYPSRSAYIDVSVAPIGGSRSVMFSARDMTEQRRVEEQLRQSQKMESVGQLTGGLAHDFNNLLTGVTGSLDMLQRRVEQGRVSEVGRYVDAAQGAANRAAALTHRLLAFSRRQTLEPKTLDANRLVKGMEDMIKRTIGPEITLEVAAEAGLWPVQIDPGQLENALLNLSINARDAMPGGGRLTIETSNDWVDERTARERDVPPGQYISICVSDTGTGMPPDVIAKAFDPFFTTKPIGQGTGLGLSMIYGFARQSGGQVRIDSEVGTGTKVCVYLPRHVGEIDEEKTRTNGLADAPQAEQNETVLVVDDEATVRMLITDALDDLGYKAIQAPDGAAGLKVLQSGAKIDLLITDVGMPGGLNGRQMADAARVSRPDLKVLFITGYAENAVLSHGHLDPGMHVLTKPFAMDALARRITALLV